MIIARILGGSTAARQELLRIGEVILEVNGKTVRSPEELQQAIQEAKENLSLKLAPGIATDANRLLKSTVNPSYFFHFDAPDNCYIFVLFHGAYSRVANNVAYHNRRAMKIITYHILFDLLVLHESSFRLRSIGRHASTL